MPLEALGRQGSIAKALDELLALKRYRDSNPNIREELATLTEACNGFVEISKQLAAVKEEDLGLTPLEEVDICRKLLQANVHHFEFVRPRVLAYIESRLILRGDMTMEKAIAFVTETVLASATPGTSWEVSWRDSVAESERTISNATIRNRNMVAVGTPLEIRVDWEIVTSAPNTRP